MERRRYKFTREQRLRKSLDFEQIYDRGLRAGDGHLLVFVLRNGTSSTRLGVSVSRKHGSAVVRNLKRRRLKEAFRRLQHDLPSGLDIVIVPRQRLDSELADYSRSLAKLVKKLTAELG
ncbi:MAG: ribonuclease P protein component [Planctomycetaceae bacterium]|nr:ribonuclease P protein component [Planctomycetaceae bacterium]